MRGRTQCAAGVLLCALVAGVPASDGLQAPGSSIDDVLLALSRGDAQGPLRVGQHELQDWLASPSVLPPGIDDATVVIGATTVGLTARVDIERYRDQLPPSAAAAISLIDGPIRVALAARLESARGRGQVCVESLEVAGFPFPTSLIPMIVAAFTRSADQPGGFDVTQPFDLPAGIERIRLAPGVAWLDLRPPERSSR